MIDHRLIDGFGRLWIDDIQSVAQHRRHIAPGFQGPLQRLRVNALCRAGYHHAAAGTDLVAHLSGNRQTVGAGIPGTHHRDHRELVKVQQGAPIIEHQRRTVNGKEPLGILLVLTGKDPDSLVAAQLQSSSGIGKILLAQCLPLPNNQTGHCCNVLRRCLIGGQGASRNS